MLGNLFQLTNQQNTAICTTYKRLKTLPRNVFCEPKMHSWPGVRPGHQLAAYSAPPDLLAGFEERKRNGERTRNKGKGGGRGTSTDPGLPGAKNLATTLLLISMCIRKTLVKRTHSVHHFKQTITSIHLQSIIFQIYRETTTINKKAV